MQPKLPWKQSFAAQIAAGLIYIAIGFVFFPFLFLGGIVIFFAFQDRRRPPLPTSYHHDLRSVPASDPDWKSTWMLLCESPAEKAFLELLIGTYGLRPHGRRLVGAGLKLDLQVELDRYRVDFLANDRWIIEVDGAAYHGSDAQKRYDQYRDLVLAHKGYRTLRLEARTVFFREMVALEKVQAFLAETGHQELPPLPEVAVEREPSPHALMIERNLEALLSREKARQDQAMVEPPSLPRADAVRQPLARTSKETVAALLAQIHEAAAVKSNTDEVRRSEDL